MQIHRFQTADLEIGFSADRGSLCLLRPRGLEENWLGHGTERPSLDIRLADGWLGDRQPPALLEHSISEETDPTKITITASLGPLTLRDSYTVSGRWIRRRVTLENRSSQELQVKGLRLLVPGVRIGLEEHCLFEAPGTAVRPRLPLSVAASQVLGAPPSEALAPGARARWGMAMETAPDCTPGLMAVNNTEDKQVLLCWYFSEVEEALPAVDGTGESVTLIHDSALAGWLPPGQALNGGDQYLLAFSGSWREAMLEYRRTFPSMGLEPALYRQVPDWVAGAGICSVFL